MNGTERSITDGLAVKSRADAGLAETLRSNQGGAGKRDIALSLHARDEILGIIGFLEDFGLERETALELSIPDPYFKMAGFLVRNHLEAKPVTPSSLTAAAGVPYATAVRKLNEMVQAGMVEQRPRTRTGKSFTLHPSAELIENWTQMCGRIKRLATESFGSEARGPDTRDYYFGGSYMAGHSIQPPQVLPEPLTLSGGLRILVHGDPTFMVMDALKRQFEQVIGVSIHQRAFSIDRLHEEALRNAQRKTSRYDIVAVDLPWIGEFATKGVLLPLDEIMDVERLDPGDFHTAGWRAAHWAGRPYGVPSQTTPELLFFRRDLFAEAGLEPPATTDAVLEAAREFHDPAQGRYGIAWNAARGTALGHQFMMTCADFGQPLFNLDEIAGGFDADHLQRDDLRPTIDSEGSLEAAEYLLALARYSPPDILSMSWYERVRPYAAGKIAMAYGYTLLAPYFELDPSSPAHGQTGYLPHPAGPKGSPVAPVGGYVLGIPSNLPEERRAAAVDALVAFTSPEAQKLYVQNGSRTAPRYSVGADPEVRRLSPIFEAVDGMSWRDELQFWPRPPVPEICDIINICGQELHDMLRGIVTPRDALRKAQSRAEEAMKT
jgi:multiple sugar transport system substrate-binding protein